MDILNYETAFAWVSSELNAMPICLGSDFKGFENLDLMTPEMLLKCKNSSRSPVGFAEMATPSRLLAQLEKAKKAWWKVFTEEGIQRFIPRGSKWGKTSQQPKVGDVVIFTRSESELGTLWRVGLVEDLIISPKDGLARDVVIKYKYHPEEKIYKQKEFKTTHRAVRKIAILETESELGLKQVLSQASKKANINFLGTTVLSTVLSLFVEPAASLVFRLLLSRPCYTLLRRTVLSALLLRSLNKVSETVL